MRLRMIALLAAAVGCLGRAAKVGGDNKKGWQQQMLFRERLIAGAGARGTAQTFLRAPSKQEHSHARQPRAVCPASSMQPE